MKETKKDLIFNDENLFATKSSISSNSSEVKINKEIEIKAEKKSESKIDEENFDDLFKPMKSSYRLLFNF